MQFRPILLIALSLAATIRCGESSAAETSMHATIGQPAILPVLPPTRTGTARGAEPLRLVVTVVGYTPSTDGPVLGVVTLRCGSHEVEVGRFGVFPDQPFTPAQPGRSQRYGFSMPVCDGPASAVVSLEPLSGSGRGAAMQVAAATLE